MKDRGKKLELFNGEACFMENFSTSSDFPCKKHPGASSSSGGGGICALCLRDKLVELVCPECGEQRPSSCSCSEISSDPNSNPEIGSVGRISFLLENEKTELSKHPKSSEPKTREPAILKRSNSSCVADVNSRGGFWKIGRLFRKKKEKGGYSCNCEKNEGSEMWVSDIVGVPRSRSLCSFRGGGGGGVGVGSGNGNGGGGFFYDTEEGGVIHSAARASSVSGGFMMDSAKRSCFSESEARISNFEARMSNFEYEKDLMAKGIFTMREGCEFSSGDDPKFIDLKLDLSSSEIRTEHPVLKKGALMATKEFGFGSMRAGPGGDFVGSNEHYGMLMNGAGSYRFSVSERELKKCRKSRKVWRWFFRASSKLEK